MNTAVSTRTKVPAFLIIVFLVAPTSGYSTGQSQNITERGYQDREILYELQSPETHAFRITHD